MKKNVIQLIILIAVVFAILAGNVGIALNVPAKEGEDVSIDLLPIDTTDEGDTDEDPEATESAEGDVNAPEVDNTEKPADADDSATVPTVPEIDAPAEPDTEVNVTPPVDEPSVPADTEEPTPAPVVPDDTVADTEAPTVDSTEEAESADVSESGPVAETEEIKEEVNE